MIDVNWIEWGYWGLLLAAALSATIIPFSSEVILIAFLGSNFVPFYAILFASIGNIIGGIITYYTGFFAAKGFKKKKISPKTEKFVNAYGPVTAFFSWLPFVGDIIVFFLGWYRAKIIFVVTWMTLGKSLRYILISWPWL